MKKIFMRLPTGIKIILIAAIYFVIALSGLQYSFQSSNATPLWPASGFAFAVLLIAGTRLAPGIFIGAFAANFYAFILNNTCPPFTAAWVSVIIGLGNTAEALTGHYLLRKFGKLFLTQTLFKKVNLVVRFLFVTIAMTITSCSIGATSLLLADIISTQTYSSVWFTWWTGDITGIILITPLILVFNEREFFHKDHNYAGAWETMIVMAATMISSGIVFLNWFSPDFLFTRAFIVTPFLVWSAIRLSAPLITSLLLISAITAFAGTINGIGPFIAPTINESLLTAALFVSINSVTALIIKAAMTERWQAHLVLRASRDQLDQMVKERTKELESKNKELERRNQDLASFNYAVSHDLQEPLRKILTFGDSLLSRDKSSLPENDKTLLVKIQSASSRMKKLLENLLSYLHLDNKEKVFEPVDLNEVLKAVQTDLSENIIKEDAVIDASILPIVHGLNFQLEQLFTNLISNALKFRKKEISPRITVSAKLVKGKSLSNQLSELADNYHYLTFKDNGIGFPEEYSEKIFEIFQRLHAQSEFTGTGIGLAICKKIVETHNGYIHATSQPGEGTTIHIYLPAENI